MLKLFAPDYPFSTLLYEWKKFVVTDLRVLDHPVIWNLEKYVC
jgi:hypothetical protein